jgi:hypothetical protein
MKTVGSLYYVHTVHVDTVVSTSSHRVSAYINNGEPLYDDNRVFSTCMSRSCWFC